MALGPARNEDDLFPDGLPEGRAYTLDELRATTTTPRHRHAWAEKFGPWCRRCHRAAMFTCACGEGRCLYHVGRATAGPLIPQKKATR